MTLEEKEILFKQFLEESKRINEALKISNIEMLEARLEKRELILEKLMISPCKAMSSTLYRIKRDLEVLERDNVLKLELLIKEHEENTDDLKQEKNNIKNIKNIKNNYFLGRVAKEESSFDLKN